MISISKFAIVYSEGMPKGWRISLLLHLTLLHLIEQMTATTKWTLKKIIARKRSRDVIGPILFEIFVKLRVLKLVPRKSIKVHT